ncbi:MAG: class I SAM-dependent methyltransferase [Pedosphaera sp.]|nr:class I SAM-dependent methyltransferase [Pedosphaera sp.]
MAAEKCNQQETSAFIAPLRFLWVFILVAALPRSDMSDALVHRSCPVCAGSKSKPHWQKGELRIVTCHDCRMVFANPAPAGMASGEFYDTEGAAYYLSPAKLESDYADVRFERELKLFRAFCPRGAVLDVGCGSGAFLFQLQKRWPGDYETLGTDVSGAPLDYAESRGVPVARGNFLEQDFGEPGDLGKLSAPHPGPLPVGRGEGGRRPGEGFDAITLWAVAEHLAEPKKFLTQAHALLKPDGLCFVLVPNLRSLAVRLLGPKYRYVYPQHLNYFSADTLSRLGEGSGFEIVATRFTHFNPVVIWQDWRGGGREVSNVERGELLKRTTALKQKPWLKPVKWGYALAEKSLAALGLADNVALVLRKK